MDSIAIANEKTLQQFIESYLPPGDTWKTWIHPSTKTEHSITLHTAKALSQADFDACFNLIQHTSASDYRRSKDGWKPRSKKKEMKLLDLKYILVKTSGLVEGFMSFMPTYEDDYPVIYCYEIHLSESLQGTGLGSYLMKLLETIANRVPTTAKVMLTVFTVNQRGVRFYEKLGFTKDDFSPPPKILRHGISVEAEYVILSKEILR